MTPLQRIWQEALQLIAESRAEVHALFLEDARWHRAATLPFTREISRLSGSSADFTSRRADDLHREAIERAQAELKALAAEQRHELQFEVLTEGRQAAPVGSCRQCPLRRHRAGGTGYAAGIR